VEMAEAHEAASDARAVAERLREKVKR
jgi:hypothetical protein